MKPNYFLYTRIAIMFILLPAPTNAQGFSWVQGFTATGASNAQVEVSVRAIDDSNNVYTSGIFTGTVDVDQSTNTYNLTSVGQYNAFLLKEDAAGNFLWVKHLVCKSATNPGYGLLGVINIAFDAAGNIYMAGDFTDTIDFDPGLGTFYMGVPPPTSTGVYGNMFVMKLNKNGDFTWAKQFNANNTCMVMDASGLYLAMAFDDTIDADPDTGVINFTSTGMFTNTLIEKLDTSGHYVWAKQLNGGVAAIYGMALDSLSNIHIVGGFSDTVDFDPGIGVANLYSGSSSITISAIFVAKYDSAGNYLWVKQAGQAANQQLANDVSVDRWGNIAVTGNFTGTVDFDPGSGVYNLTSNSTRSIFTLKLRNNGDFVWARKAGNNVGLYEGRGIATDTTCNVYVISNTYPTQKFDSSGNLLWTLATAGTNGWIALDNNNSIYLSGSFSGTQDFDPGIDTFLLSGSGLGSGFIQKFCQGPVSIIPITASDTITCMGDTITLSAPIILGKYTWKRNNATLPDTVSSIKITTTGVYSLRVASSCPSFGSIALQFYQTTNPTISLPIAPVIVMAGQPVTVMATVGNIGTGYNIDWYRNGILLATTQHINTLTYTKTPGTDTITAVIYEELNHYCNRPDTSNTIIVQELLGLNELHTSGINCYPSPFQNMLYLTGLTNSDKLMMTDVTGRMVYTSTANERSLSINTTSFAMGWYLLRVVAADGRVKVNMPMVKR